MVTPTHYMSEATSTAGGDQHNDISRPSLSVVGMALGMELGAALGTLVSAALQAVMAIFFMAVYAATHFQLARPAPAAPVTPIE